MPQWLLRTQVLDTDPNNGRRLEVSASLLGPRATVIWQDHDRSFGRTGEMAAEEEGDYQICFHNR